MAFRAARLNVKEQRNVDFGSQVTSERRRVFSGNRRDDEMTPSSTSVISLSRLASGVRQLRVLAQGRPGYPERRLVGKIINEGVGAASFVKPARSTQRSGQARETDVDVGIESGRRRQKSAKTVKTTQSIRKCVGQYEAGSAEFMQFQ
ncbi:hypothetical protein Bbelb_208170 [Branchiostoma belcheri]|nr:hypothetical protein Bbelb_208170 [Branchiostoma belcheri]